MKLKVVIVAILMQFMFLNHPVHALEDISSTYAIVYNVKDQSVLYNKAANDKMYPASMTKIMSALVALDKIQDVHTTITMQAEAFYNLYEQGASVAGFYEGQVLTYEDLLAGLLLSSGADAANQLAISLFGSEEAMVEAMNQKAVSLQLQGTHFMNVSGLHDDNHYSTAYDLAIIMNQVLQVETIKNLLQQDQYTCSDGTILNATLLTRKQASGLDSFYIKGGKTGFTLEAQNCLVSFADVNGEVLISVVAHSEVDSQAQVVYDSETLYSYFYTNYERIQLIKKGEEVGKVSVSFALEDKYSVIANKNHVYFLEKGSSLKQFETVLHVKKQQAPILANEVVGSLEIKNQDKTLDTIDVAIKDTAIRDEWAYFRFVSWRTIQTYKLIIVTCIVFTVGVITLLKVRRNTNKTKSIHRKK